MGSSLSTYPPGKCLGHGAKGDNVTLFCHEGVSSAFGGGEVELKWGSVTGYETANIAEPTRK
jgi:hypothetical protein